MQASVLGHPTFNRKVLPRSVILEGRGGGGEWGGEDGKGGWEGWGGREGGEEGGQEGAAPQEREPAANLESKIQGTRIRKTETKK